MMKDLLKLNLPITVYETDIKKGGLSSAILEYMNTLDEKNSCISYWRSLCMSWFDSFFTYSRRY